MLAEVVRWGAGRPALDPPAWQGDSEQRVRIGVRAGRKGVVGDDAPQAELNEAIADRRGGNVRLPASARVDEEGRQGLRLRVRNSDREPGCAGRSVGRLIIDLDRLDR